MGLQGCALRDDPSALAPSPIPPGSSPTHHTTSFVGPRQSCSISPQDEWASPLPLPRTPWQSSEPAPSVGLQAGLHVGMTSLQLHLSLPPSARAPRHLACLPGGPWPPLLSARAPQVCCPPTGHAAEPPPHLEPSLANFGKPPGCSGSSGAKLCAVGSPAGVGMATPLCLLHALLWVRGQASMAQGGGVGLECCAVRA